LQVSFGSYFRKQLLKENFPVCHCLKSAVQRGLLWWDGSSCWLFVSYCVSSVRVHASVIHVWSVTELLQLLLQCIVINVIR